MAAFNSEQPRGFGVATAFYGRSMPVASDCSQTWEIQGCRGTVAPTGDVNPASHSCCPVSGGLSRYAPAFADRLESNEAIDWVHSQCAVAIFWGVVEWNAAGS